MKITDVRSTTVAVPLEASLRYANGVHPGRFIRTLIEVDTDEGITGLGEIGGSGASNDALIEAVKERALGRDPYRTEQIRWAVYNPTEVAFYEDLTQGFSALEFACLDIQGKAVGRPVHELLGGALRDEIPFSAYLFFRYPTDDAGPVHTPEQMVEHCRDLVERYGFRTIKLKGGVFKPEHEVEVTRALRDAFPDALLRFDPNSNWSVPEAITHARAFEDIGLEYYEDPVLGLAGMAQVKKRTWLPLATNTVVVKIDQIPQAVAMDAVDVVLDDPHFFGGIRACVMASGICGVFGLGVGMHSSGECGVSLAAMLHAAAAMPELGHAADAHYHHMTDDIIVGGKLEYRNGALAVPTGPGLGVELDPDQVERYHRAYLDLGPYVFTGDTLRPEWVPMIPERDWPEP